MTMALRAFHSVLCPDCNSVSTSLRQIIEGLLGPSAVIEPRDLRFHVKIFLVTEFFFVFRQSCVLNSGKVVF